MSLPSVFLTVGCVIWATSAGADSCAHRIFFLPSMHNTQSVTGHNVVGSTAKEVAASQLKVVQYLDRFPDRPVFFEDVMTEDFEARDVSPEDLKLLKTKIEAAFPQGFQLSPQQLTDLQIEKLVNNGGPFVQMMRGRLGVIHHIMEDQATDDRIFKPILKWMAAHPSNGYFPPEISRLVFGAREEQALLQITKYFARNPDAHDAILVFGGNHNFAFYPNLFPPQCIIVPSEFKADWSGQYRSGPEGFPPELMRTGTLPSANPPSSSH